MMNIWKKANSLSVRHPSSVAYRDKEGLFIGHDGSGWLFRSLPLQSLVWQDFDVQVAAAERLSSMFSDLVATTKGSMLKGTKFGIEPRRFHLLRLSWGAEVDIPDNTSDDLREWLDNVFTFGVGKGLLAIGVQLRAVGLAGAKNDFDWLSSIKNAVADFYRTSAGGPPDPGVFAADRALISSILGRAGGVPPNEEEAAQMESWWNGGRGCHCVITSEPDGRSLSSDAWANGFEIASLVGFDQVQLRAERGLWVADAFGHQDGVMAFSVKGELWPAETARDYFRKGFRKAKGRLEEHEKTGDLRRIEDSDMYIDSETLEAYFADTSEPLIRDASVLFARKMRLDEGYETYIDNLRRRWGLRVKPIEFRQIEGLREMMPCFGTVFAKQKPFSQDMTTGLIAGSGAGSYSTIGDKQGVWIGLSPPDQSPVWLDTKGSARRNKPPAMAVLGVPGSGKTFLLQLIATQASLNGDTVVMINPKPHDSLEPFANAIGGTTITLSALQEVPGSLDPFRWAEPEIAAEIAVAHIGTVLSGILDDIQLVNLSGAFKRSAQQGARTVGQCLRSQQVDPVVAKYIEDYAIGSSLFRMGIAEDWAGPLKLDKGALTLIQFDRGFSLPTKLGALRDMEGPDRDRIATLRLISRAAGEMMFAGNGGVLIIDEAHVFLGSAEGKSSIQRWGREGRSQGVLPILATQQVADILADGTDLSSYLGRVTVLRMIDDREIEAALDLCGLEMTPQRAAWLRAAGPIREEGRPALALHKDLDDNVAALLVGPVPPEVHNQFSTNLDDRENRAIEDEIQRLQTQMEKLENQKQVTSTEPEEDVLAR